MHFTSIEREEISVKCRTPPCKADRVRGDSSQALPGMLAQKRPVSRLHPLWRSVVTHSLWVVCIFVSVFDLSCVLREFGRLSAGFT